MRKTGQSSLVLLVVGALSVPAWAGVTVTQGVDPSLWAGDIMTVANPPTVQADVNEQSLAQVASQTFVATDSANLGRIQLLTSGDALLFNIRLVDLGPAPSPANNISPYAAGTDLWNSELQVTFFGSATPGILQLDFDGTHAVALTAGNLYAFEVALLAPPNPAPPDLDGPMTWYRTGNAGDTYPGGAAYRNRSHINGSNAREFALTVTIPEPASMLAVGMGLMAVRRRHA